MNATRNLDQITTSLKKRLDYYETLLQAWEKVTRNFTKSGKPFKVMSKNFNGCKFRDDQYTLLSGNKKVSVTAFSNLQGYISDDFNTMINCQYEGKPEDESRIIKGEMIADHYEMTVEEIAQTIEKRKQLYREHIKNINDQLARSADVFNKFKAAIDEAVKNLKDEERENTSLYYLCRDYMKSIY